MDPMGTYRSVYQITFFSEAPQVDLAKWCPLCPTMAFNLQEIKSSCTLSTE